MCDHLAASGKALWHPLPVTERYVYESQSRQTFDTVNLPNALNNNPIY